MYTLHDPHFKMCWVPSADYFNIIMTKFMINNRTDAWICWIDSGFAFIRSRIIDSTWIDFKMASRFSMFRNMAFRRNLRPICQLVRRSFVGKDTTISKLCIINIFWFIEPTSRHKKPCSMFMFGEQGRKFQKGWLMIVKHNFNWSVFYLPNWLDSTLNLPFVFLIYRNLWNKNKTCDFCEQHQVTFQPARRARALHSSDS